MRKKKKEQKYIMVEKLDEKTLMKILQKQFSMIDKLSDDFEDLVDLSISQSDCIEDMHQRIEFLECHVNVLETDQFDLYVDRVVNW